MSVSAGLSEQRRKGGHTQNGDNISGKYGNGSASGYQNNQNHHHGSGNNYNNGNNGSWANHHVNRNDEHRAPPRPSNSRDYDLKGAEQGIQGLSVHSGSNGQQDRKKMTWATVASQPAKPQVSTTSLLVKKKGKGMPPPPMVNLDIGSWDTPVREATPPPSPPTPPPVEPTPIPLNAQHQQAIEREEQQLKQQQQQQRQDNRNNHHHHQNGPGGGQYGGGHPRDNHHYQNNRDNRDNNGYYNQREKRPWNNNNNNGPPAHHQGQNNVRGAMGHNHNNGYNGGGDRGGYGGGGFRHSQPRSHSPPPAAAHYQQHNNNQPQPQRPQMDQHVEQQQQQPQGGRAAGEGKHGHATRDPKLSVSDSEEPELTAEALDQVMDKDNYNPPQVDMERGRNARFFVIKSYSEDDIHRSIKYKIWCSTEHGNKRLDQAYRDAEADEANVLLFFSVNGSGHFCGIAQMISAVDYNSKSTVWAQDKWRGVFQVKWIYVKDVPNTLLRQIRLENNENKPVTNSRDTQEVPNPQGLQMLEIIHGFEHTTSIFDDFVHYEKRQEEEDSRKHVDGGPPRDMAPRGHHYQYAGQRGGYQNNHNGSERGQYGGNNRGYGGGDGYNRRGGYGHRDNNYDGGYNNRDRDNYDNGYQQRSFGPREDRDNYRRDNYRDNNNYRGGGGRGGNNMMNHNNNRGERWNNSSE